ncbi:MAG: acireductone dioxygenase, partial [Luteimonas sp.]
MSRLRIFADQNPDAPEFESSDFDSIAHELRKIGVAFDRWQTNQPVAAGASQEEVIAAYKDDIDRISAERGFTTVDVVSIAPDNPKREEMRSKFLDEHFHKEDEVRFFVAGSGLFTLHVDGKVYEIE